jgi:hypothetical protein
MKKTQVAITNAIPTKREVSAEFTALSDKLTALQAERQMLDVARQELIRKIEFNPGPTARDVRAARIVDASNVVGQPDHERLRVIAEQIGDLERAIEMLRERIDTEGRHASSLVIEKIEARHTELVSQICAALISAHRANQKYHALADTLTSEGVGWGHLMPMQPNKLLGHPRDNYSDVALYLRQAAALGHISPATVPVELRI